ncbi:MAG TPA: nucleotidyltransferase domain-containing protein [Desulfatiglandales bacterium]|nr:nucleotidyltransferase domain-containing protein [Desulfatiglandales bacterium]
MSNAPMAKSRIVDTLRSYFQREASHFRVEAAFLYGSWAAGFPRLDSDIDIAVLFDDEGIPADEVFERLTDITLDLIKSLSSEVNVMLICRDFRKPMLYYNAIIKGIPLFFTSRQKYIALINEALYHMEDFENFGRKWLIDLTTRNLEEIRHA